MWTLTIVGLLLAFQPATGDQQDQPAPGGRGSPMTCEAKNPDPANPIRIDAGGADIGAYLRGFSKRIKENWKIPSTYAGTNGCAIISFRLFKDGRVDTLVVENPSEIPALTEFARNAILKSAPFEPLPTTVQREFTTVTCTFFYRLGGQDQPSVSTEPSKRP